MKRILSALLASIFAFCPMNLINTHGAFLSSTPENGNYAIKQREENDKHYLKLDSEILKRMNQTFIEPYEVCCHKKIVNAWLISYESKDNGFSSYACEYKKDDNISIHIDLPLSKEGVTEEISNYITTNIRNSNITDVNFLTETIDGNVICEIYFDDNNHDINYMTCEKAFSILNEKYPVTMAVPDINNVSFDTKQVYFTDWNGKKHMLDEEQLKEVDFDFLEKECKVSFDPETQKIVFAEDATEINKLDFYRYISGFDNAELITFDLCNEMITKVDEITFNNINFVNGDANIDSLLNLADSVAVLQSIANPDKYELSPQGKFNADMDGDGLTTGDALEIQKQLLNVK